MTFLTGLLIGIMFGGGLATIGVACLTSGSNTNHWLVGYRAGVANERSYRRRRGVSATEPGEPVPDVFSRN